MVVDDSKVTLKQITRAISKNLGTNKFKNVPLEDALLNKDLSVKFDILLCIIWTQVTEMNLKFKYKLESKKLKHTFKKNNFNRN